MTTNAIASQPVSTKKVQLRIYRLATPRKISDCSHVSQSGDPVRKSQWGQQGKEFSWSPDEKDSIPSSWTCAFNMISMVFLFSTNTSFHFKAYKSQDQRLSMTSQPFNHCFCPC